MNKTIHVTLSQGGINKAIRELEAYQRRIERNTARLVDELVDGGAEMAEYAFGGSAVVDKISENGTGIIEAVGKAVPFMEFGAGLATMESHRLARNAPFRVQEWSYSEEVGSGEGFETGRWHFGGKVYTEVIPRHGLLDARDFIEQNLEEKARKVFSR